MSEQEREERPFLGLTHNPFIEPHRGFFERGGRKTHLEQLRHLSEWSRRVLLVTGPHGVGKTVLFRELAATLEPRVKAARINASLVNTGFEVLCAIAQGFGLAIPAQANTQSLRMDLIEHVERQSESDRLCLTLVDDAHLLDNKALDSLIALTHESAMHLVLFGEVRMVPAVERTASAKGVGWQEIRLTGYGDADARDYLEWRFQQARYRGRVPFTDNEVRDLIKLSEGLPGRINQMANVLLVKLETGEGVVAGRGFPRLHAAMLALLVVLIALLYVIFGEQAPEATPEQLAAVEPAAMPVESEEPAQPEPSAEALPAAATDAGAAAASSSSADEGEAGADGVDQVPDLPEVAGMAPIEAAAAEPPAQEVTSPATGATGATEAAAASAAEPYNTSSPDREPAAAAASVELPAGTKDTNWLLKQDASYYTLQLVTVSTAERAAAFVARQREPGEFTIYQLQRDGRVLHVVLYGLFSSRDAAQAAADNLPGEVGNVQPWIRQLEQVQAAARITTFQ